MTRTFVYKIYIQTTTTRNQSIIVHSLKILNFLKKKKERKTLLKQQQQKNPSLKAKDFCFRQYSILSTKSVFFALI